MQRQTWRWPLALVVLLAAAGGAVLLDLTDSDGRSQRLASGTATSSTSSSSSTTATTAPSLFTAPLELDRIGPIVVGMTYAEAEAAAGVELDVEDALNTGGACVYVNIVGGPDGLTFLGGDGRIQLVVVEGGATRTREGIGMSSARSEVRAAYGSRLQARPHDYIDDPEGYLFLDPEEDEQRAFRLLFELRDDAVASMRAGFDDWVALPEACA